MGGDYIILRNWVRFAYFDSNPDKTGHFRTLLMNSIRELFAQPLAAQAARPLRHRGGFGPHKLYDFILHPSDLVLSSVASFFNFDVSRAHFRAKARISEHRILRFSKNSCAQFPARIKESDGRGTKLSELRNSFATSA